MGEVFSCSSTTVQALMLAPMHIMQISPKRSFEPSQQPIPPLTLQRQQRVDRSSQSCQGCLCQTQPIVRVPYSLMRRCYTADLMGGGKKDTGAYTGGCMCRSNTHWLNESVPEESNLRQQSENPYSTAKCKGNIPWIPRLAIQKFLKKRNSCSQHV